MDPDRIVVGAFEAEDGERVAGLHAKLDAQVSSMDVASAELVKLAANASSRRASASSTRSRTSASSSAPTSSTSPRGRPRPSPRPAFPQALASASAARASRRTPRTQAARRRTRATIPSPEGGVGSERAAEAAGRPETPAAARKLRGRTVALLGLAFKPNTDDMREAPRRVIAARLIAEGAEVRGWDPVARPEIARHRALRSVLDAVRGADAAIVVTEWPELREAPERGVARRDARPLIVDGRNLLDPRPLRPPRASSTRLSAVHKATATGG